MSHDSNILLQEISSSSSSSSSAGNLKFQVASPKPEPIQVDYSEPVAPADDVYTWSKLMYLSLLATILAIVGLSVNWYLVRIITAPMSLANGTILPTAGPSTQVSYDFSLTSVTSTSLTSRNIRDYDQYILPDVQSVFIGVRAAVIVSLVGGLLSCLNFMILSQGWLQSTLTFYIAKHWYRIQMPMVLPTFAFIGAVCGMLVLLALPPAFLSDDVLVQLNNPQGGSNIPIQNMLSCANSKAIIDCSQFFETKVQTQTLAQYNIAHRPAAGWYVMLFSSLLTLYILHQAFMNRQRLMNYVDAALRVEDNRETEMAQAHHNNL